MAEGFVRFDGLIDHPADKANFASFGDFEARARLFSPPRHALRARREGSAQR